MAAEQTRLASFAHELTTSPCLHRNSDPNFNPNTRPHAGGAPVKTMTKEWQEQSNKRSLDEKINPISGE